MSGYNKRSLKQSQELTRAVQHVQDPLVNFGSTTDREAVVRDLTSQNNELLHQARKTSLANPPYRKVRGGKTRRKQRGRKHRKTRHRR